MALPTSSYIFFGNSGCQVIPFPWSSAWWSVNRAFLDQRRANELVNTFLTLLPLFDTYYHPFCDRKDRQRNRNNNTSRDLFTWVFVLIYVARLYGVLPCSAYHTLIELNWWACDWQQICHQYKKNVSYLYGICLNIGKCVECINITNALSSAEASLYCGEAGEKEKESARGTMGRGKREERLPPFPSSHRSPRAFYFCRLLIFWWGYPAGASAEERVTNVSHFGPQTRNNQKCYSIKSYSSRKKEFIVLNSANLITGIQEKILEAKSSFRNN